MLLAGLGMGCTEDPAGESAGAVLRPAHGTVDGILRVRIAWPGDDFPTQADLALRARLEERVLSQGGGRVVGRAGGMGWMAFEVQAADPARVREDLQRAAAELEAPLRLVVE